MINTITDYVKHVYETVKDRLKNPFTDSNRTPFAGAFVIAFIIYNWELIFSLISFDTKETRLSKIEIIKGYLESEVWYSRIGVAIGFAFASITLFYIFNYASLGLTTFFKRWYKGWILYYTDRGQTIPRTELDRNNIKINTYKKNYADLKDAYSQVEDERNELSSQLTNLTSQYSKATSEIEQLKQTIEQTRLSTTTTTTTKSETEKQFQVAFAQYGINKEFKDVTNKVSDLLKINHKFTVDNRTLGVDPSKFFVKELLIVYLVDNEKFTLTANEEELVELKENKLIATSTEKSRVKQSYIINEKRLPEIFNGEWTLSSKKPGENYKERVIIDDTGKYYSNLKFSFYIKTIQIDENTKKIKFNKVRPDRTLHSKEDLTIINEGLIKGADSLGFTLEYNKIS
jgi:hypothetical protein